MGDIYDLCGPGHECPACKGRFAKPKASKPNKKQPTIEERLEKRLKNLERELKELKKQR